MPLAAQDSGQDPTVNVQLAKWSNPNVVFFGSAESNERLARCGMASDFYRLVNYFQPQVNGSWCGMASSAIVLNALRVPAGRVESQRTGEIQLPEERGGRLREFRLYLQQDVLNEKTESVKPRAATMGLEKMATGPAAGRYDAGLRLEEISAILDTHGLKTAYINADGDQGADVEGFRATVKQVMADSGSFLILNFASRELGRPGGGHFSPLAAYDEQTDSLLILDVATASTPWFWVPLEEMYDAMQTLDGETFRGWVVVREGLESAPEPEGISTGGKQRPRAGAC